MGKHKKPMPSFYGKNIAQNAQRKFFQRKKAQDQDQGKGQEAATKDEREGKSK